MGVRGFMTYAENQGYFVPHELESTLLIIDAGAMVQLSVDADYDLRLGGDYKKMYTSAFLTFLLLKKCNITPIVVEDGHYKEEKYGTIRKRSDQGLKSMIDYKQQNYKKLSEASVPILHIHATRDAIDDLGICRCRVEFDADEEIIELARKLKCPVVGNDSDFCLSDGVDFILWDSLDFDSVLENPESQSSVKCLRFDRETFLADHGVSPSVLPFLSVLFPSDYSQAALFYKIFPKKGSVNPILKYEIALTWMKDKTAEQILDQVMLLKPENRSKEDFEKEINFAVNNYINCAATVIPVLEKNRVVGNYVKNVQFNIQESDLNGKYNVPLYIADKVKSCQLEATILTFFVSDVFVLSANTHEDVDEKSAYYPSVRIIQGMFGLLSKYLEKTSMTLAIREGQRFINLMLKPLIIKNEESSKILYEIMEINCNVHEDLQQFDDGWKIFILTLMYLRDKCRDIVNSTHIQSFILTAFAIHVGKYEKFKKKENVSFPLDRFKEIEAQDCEYFISKKMKSWEIRRKNNVVLKNILHIHIYLTFQACLKCVIEIIPLLELPYRIRISDFLAGDLYHSVYIELKDQWNCMRYISNRQFFGSDKLKSLHNLIVSNKIVRDLL